MSELFNKIVAICLFVILGFSNVTVVFAEEPYKKGHITICYVGNNERLSYDAIDVNGELFVSPTDIAKIINMNATTCNNSVFYSNYYANRSIDVGFDGNIWTRGTTYTATVHKVNDTYYFPLEKILYLANAQWYEENNIIFIQLTDNTILDFIDAYYIDILDNNITQADLLINGESELSNAVKSSFAAIFNDFDVRIFVPVWGTITLTVEDYQKAMLQLAKDEFEFIDEYGQIALNELLDESSFSEIKSVWDDAQSVADLPENILSATDCVNQIYLWLKDQKNGTKMFSEYNNLADFTPAQIKAISKNLQGVSDALTIVNAIVNVNEIAIRSKSWNEDFLAQIRLLTDFDETGYNKSMVNYIKKASSSLLEEHADSFSAAEDAFIEETLKVLGEKLVDLTPAGTFTSILTTGLGIAKLLNEDFATSFDALEISNMVEWLIRIEHVAFTEMTRDIQTMRINSLKGGSTLKELTELRNTTMLSLRTNLRNKVFIYYLNTARNNDPSWVYSDEAKEIEQDILWNYAKIIELNECKPFDALLPLSGFENMYSNNFGCKRNKVASAFVETTNNNKDEIPDNNTNSYVIDAYESDITYITERYDFETGKFNVVEKTCIFRIPQINIPNIDTSNINKEIYESLFPFIDESVKEIKQDGMPYTCEEVSYRYFLNNNILSIVILSKVWPILQTVNVYEVYNVNILNGSIVTKDELLKSIGMSKKHFIQKSQQALKNIIIREYEADISNNEILKQILENTTSIENIEKADIYLAENGDVCIIAEKYIYADYESLPYDINIINFEKSYSYDIGG